MTATETVDRSVVASREVPFFNYPALYAERRNEYLAAIDDVLSRGAFIMQKDLTSFESELAAYLGVKHAIGVADGTIALTIALKLAGVGLGDEVIVPSHTFVATAAAVHHCGAVPVLCDCGPDHMLDVSSARHVLSARTKAVMPVQLNGRTADMDSVMAFAASHGLTVVEDSCQALGAKYDGRFAGTFGIAGSYSFYPAKTLGAFGDGGALVVNDDSLAALAREYRDHGRGADGDIHRFGHNGRLDNLQAAVLRIKLRSYDRDIARRRAIARLYEEELGEMTELLLPPGPDTDPKRFDIFQNYEIEAEGRDELRTYLANRGVGTILQWGGKMLHQFSELRLRAHAPYAADMSSRFMLLPLHHLLTDEDVRHVCDRIKEFYIECR